MTAKEYLSRYKTAHREAKDIELRMAQLKLKYAMPAAIQYSDMPQAHNSEHDMSDYIVRMEELADLLIRKYTECMGIEIDILQRLDRMEKQEERELLRYRYVDGLGWHKIADRMHMAERTVYYTHGTALQHFHMPDDPQSLQ